jgi:hypothetical protein
MNTVRKSQLYDQDFCLWVAEIVSQLKSKEFGQLDLENLIEEIESLGKRDRRELERRLRVLLSHLLKRGYVFSLDDLRGWEITIRDQCRELQSLLNQFPSLKQYLFDVFEETWQQALSEVEEDYSNIEFPASCPFPNQPEVLLSDRFWENTSEI